MYVANVDVGMDGWSTHEWLSFTSIAIPYKGIIVLVEARRSSTPVFTGFRCREFPDF